MRRRAPPKRTKTHLNDEGGNVGGPIWKNKVFLFANYEQQIGFPANLRRLHQLPAADAGDAGRHPPPTTTPTPAATWKRPASSFYPERQRRCRCVTSRNTKLPLGDQRAHRPRELAAVNQFKPEFAALATTSLPYQNIATWHYGTNTKNIYPTTRLDWQIKPTMDFHDQPTTCAGWRKLPGTQVYNGDQVMVNNFKSSYQTITAGFDWTISPHIVNQVNVGILNDQEHYSYDNSYDPYASVNNIIYSSPTFTNGGSVLAPTIPTNALTEPRNNPVPHDADIRPNVIRLEQR